MLASIKPIKMSYVYKQQFIFNNVKKVFTLIHSSLLHKQQTFKWNHTINTKLDSMDTKMNDTWLYSQSSQLIRGDSHINVMNAKIQ